MEMIKHPTSKEDILLKVSKGHFATGHSHINYYIDVTSQNPNEEITDVSFGVIDQ